MLLWMIELFFADADGRLENVGIVGSTVVRAICAASSALVVTVLLGPLVIHWLRRRFLERIDSASESLNRLHASKGSTPTMGGLLLVATVAGSSVVFCELTQPIVWVGLLVVAAFAAIGAADDWIKATTSRRGLTVPQKLVAQVAAALVCGLLLSSIGRSAESWSIQEWTHRMPVVAVASLAIWAAVVLVATSNSVNLADGLDGLASGCGVLAALVMMCVCYAASDASLAATFGMRHNATAGEVAVMLGSLAGALLGFLKFNRYPARVFMGDTGSLPVGALVGFAGLVARQELLLTVACGVYVIETASVIAQIGWFKTTGRRLIRCSPLHNHFVLAGDREPKVVRRFWLAGAVCAFIALACLVK
jgi:phospho-N-acetylmuramoyl-pentapeptide-transferase